MNAKRYTTHRETVVTVEPLDTAAPERKAGRPRSNSVARFELLAPAYVPDAEPVFVEGLMPAALARQIAALVSHHNRR